MNTGPESQFDVEGWDPPEWDAQEQGRGGYRHVTAAVRSAPLAEPPPDFAREVAAHVVPDPCGHLDALWMRGFAIALALALSAVAILYGPLWWESMRVLVAAGLLRQVLAASGCLVVSWAFWWCCGSTGRRGRVYSPPA